MTNDHTRPSEHPMRHFRVANAPSCCDAASGKERLLNITDRTPPPRSINFTVKGALTATHVGNRRSLVFVSLGPLDGYLNIQIGQWKIGAI